MRDAGPATQSSRRTPGPIASVSVMWKVSAACGSNSPNDGFQWLWVPAFAGTTISNPAGRQQRAFRAAGVDIDEADMQAGERLAAFHFHGVVDGRAALGHRASIRASERAEQPNIAHRVVVVVAEREGDQGFRAKAAPSPGLR